MSIQNTYIADIFRRMADLLDIRGDNPFRVRAYRNAARTISGLGRPLAEIVAAGDALTDLPGIGKDLAAKITQIIQTGSLPQLEALEKEVAPGLAALMKIGGLGPKRVQVLNRRLGITTPAELKAACADGKIRELDGFGLKTEQAILEALSAEEPEQQRIRLLEAEQWVADLIAYIKGAAGVAQVAAAGSYRRRTETVGDVDILATCRNGPALMDHFAAYPEVRKVLSKGPTRCTVFLRSGLQVDLRVVPEDAYGAALHYFTGSKAHNIAVRRRGVQRKLKINEYGVFRGEERLAGQTETEIYAAVDLPYIVPELREDQGELEAAEKGTLPDLIQLPHIRGDLHAHTNATDGKATLEQMAQAARALGYAYLAITEHSRKVAMAGGLTPEKVAAQIERIDRLNETFAGDFVLLKGIEVDILADGRLDLPDDILSRLDLRVCSVHYHQKLPREQQTERILRAMDNPWFNILGHPTGRLINARRPYAVDMARIMRAALERGCFLELNAHPYRLDLNDIHCRMAREMGLKVAISTDAHSTSELQFMRFGVDQARRGWLTANDVLNTRSLPDLLALLKRS